MSKTATNDRVTLSATGQNLVRIIIASYFIALSVGIVPGSEITTLFSAILGEPWDRIVATLTIFGLSYMVLVGVWLRGAALLLGLALFWSSYLTMIDLGLSEHLGVFWRDLALIGALILTYAEPAPRAHQRRGLLRRKARARKFKATVRPQPVAATGATANSRPAVVMALPRPANVTTAAPTPAFKSTRPRPLAAE